VALCRRQLEWLGGGVGEGSDTVSDRGIESPVYELAHSVEGLHKTAVSGGVGEVRGESYVCIYNFFLF
jgi:hypothetical protein